MIDYSSLPIHMKTKIINYIEHGDILTGTLYRVFSGRFIHEFAISPVKETENLRILAKFLHYEAPTNCWGSTEKVKNWQLKKACNSGLSMIDYNFNK